MDTSSLLAFVRYYLPFDQNGNFKSLIQAKFNDVNILMLDKVFDEAKYISGGLILKELKFISEREKHINTTGLILSRFF